MSSEAKTDMPPPRLSLSVAVLVVALAAALVFASAFKDAPTGIASPPDAHPPKHVDTPHEMHADEEDHEPVYYAGGFWSPNLELAGLSELAMRMVFDEASLVCQSLTWENEQLIVIDVSPLPASTASSSDKPKFAVVSIDFAGGMFPNPFISAVTDHLATLEDFEQVVVFTPLLGPDPWPKNQDEQDWSYFETDNTEVIDWVWIEPTQKVHDRKHTDYLSAWLTSKNKNLSKPNDTPTPTLLLDQDLIADSKIRARLQWAIAQRDPYEAVPHLRKLSQKTTGTDFAAQPQPNPTALNILRAMRIHADDLIAQLAASEDPAMRALAARAIGELAQLTTDPLGKLTLLAEDREMAVRYEALVACRAIPGRKAAGVAELVAPLVMDDNMRSVYAGTMSQLLAFGEPIPADSRANRLRRLPINELLAQDRDAIACMILLEREDLPDEKISEVLGQLAKANETNPLTALIDLVQAMNPRTLNKREILLQTLANWKPAEIKKQTDRLAEIAKSDRAANLRSAAAAALIQTVPPKDVIAAIGTKPVIFEALAWVKQPAALKTWSNIVTQTAFADNSLDQAVIVAALDAIRYLPADSLDADTIKTLLELARGAGDPTLRFAAIRAVNNLPASLTPPDIDDLKLTSLTLRAAPGMKYDKTSLTVIAGRPVELTLVNPDNMDHNLVITTPGRGQEVGAYITGLGTTGSAAIGYIPEPDNTLARYVLFHTQMVKPGTTYTLRFISPDTPGSYDYVCSFPGHAPSMNGILQVVAP